MSLIFEFPVSKPLRIFLWICLVSFHAIHLEGQTLDSTRTPIPLKSVQLSVQKKEATRLRVNSLTSSPSRQIGQVALRQRDSLRGEKDSIGRIISPHNMASPAVRRDSSSFLTASLPQTLPRVRGRTYRRVVDSLLGAARWIDVKSAPENFVTTPFSRNGKEFAFYSICLMVLLLGLFRTFYPEYFHKLFRVYFNTSIRQNQLTDQLGQAIFPSFILNLFFAVSAGFYCWLLLRNYPNTKLIRSGLLLPFCIAAVGAVYLVKYFIIKAVGWMTGLRRATDQYIFVIFLVNKIAGIALVPFIILMEFASPSWGHPLEIFSLLLLGLFFISRYLKTYSSLENRFPLNPLHFLLYIISIEIIPLLVIYKIAVDYFI